MAYRKTNFVENKRKETRQRIVRAARALVESGGWDNCSLTKVARVSGVATGSVYTHFRKISELYVEVFLAIADEEVSVIAEIAASDASPCERFEATIITFARRALRGRVKAFAVIAQPVAAEVDAVRQKHRVRFVEQFERIIEDGISTGDFRAQNPRVAATCVLGALAETLVKPISAHGEEDTSCDALLQDEILSFCLHAIGAEQSSSHNSVNTAGGQP